MYAFLYLNNPRSTPLWQYMACLSEGVVGKIISGDYVNDRKLWKEVISERREKVIMWLSIIENA